MGDPTARLLELDARHCELLDRLAELDQRVNEVLSDWNRSKETFQEEQHKRNLAFDEDIRQVDTASEETESPTIESVQPDGADVD